MNDKRHQMLEATQLTRAGQLIEATALLQRLLRGEMPSAASGTFSDTVNAPGTGGIIEEKPRIAKAPGPKPSEHKTWTKRRSTARADTANPHMPEALRSFLERGNKIPGPLKRSPAQAPDPLPDGAHFVEKFYSSQAGSRAYKLYIPSGYHNQALPLVVMLHGCTQTPDDFAVGTRMNVLAEELTCFVAYPAQASAANPSKCWNWFTPDNQQRGAGEPSLIAGITNQIMRDYSVDPNRVYVAGLSAGGAAAAIMGMAYPDLYAAIGVHSGLACGAASDLPSAFAAMRRGAPAAFEAPSSSTGDTQRKRLVPTIVFHGDQDITVHARNGDLVIEQSMTNTAMDLHTRVEHGQAPGGHAYIRTLHADASGQVLLEQWVIHGAGHAWSGGNAAGSFADPRGPDAAREMLRFFLEHSHPAPGTKGDVTHDAAVQPQASAKAEEPKS